MLGLCTQPSLSPRRRTPRPCSFPLVSGPPRAGHARATNQGSQWSVGTCVSCTSQGNPADARGRPKLDFNYQTGVVCNHGEASEWRSYCLRFFLRRHCFRPRLLPVYSNTSPRRLRPASGLLRLFRVSVPHQRLLAPVSPDNGELAAVGCNLIRKLLRGTVSVYFSD